VLERNLVNFRDKIYNFNFTKLELNYIFFIILLLVFLAIPSHIFPLQMNILEADAPSYIDFKFDSFSSLFNQHRTFGLPLIIKFYEIFSKTLYLWPHINFTVFALSCIFLLNILLYLNFNKFFSFLFSAGILGSYNLYYFFRSWSEIFSVCFIIIALCFFLLSIKKNKNHFFFLFSFFLFYSYQIRPSFIIYITIFPSFFFFYYFLNKSFFFLQKKILLKTLISVFVPLFFFIMVRFFLSGHIGIAPFAGVNIAGHATFYLNDKTVSRVYDNKEFTKSLIERKKKHKFPCNINIIDFDKYSLEFYEVKKLCFNINVMSGWLEMIKQEKNIQPFPNNDKRNFNAWEHVYTLANFFTAAGDNNLVDKKLSNYAWEIILLDNKYLHFKWFFYSFFQSFYLQFLSQKNLLFIYFFIIFFYTGSFFSKKKFVLKKKFDPTITSLVLSIILCHFFSLLLLATTNIPYIRALASQSVLFAPLIMTFVAYCLYENRNKI
jgi:hypothetical protein